MDKKKLGVILTILTIGFCACPGMVICMAGAIMALAGGAASGGDNTFLLGIVAAVVGMLMFLTPALIAAVTYFSSPGKPKDWDDPLPPAI